MPGPSHRIRAIRYARHDRPAHENFLGGGDAPDRDDHAFPMPLDYYVWAIDRAGAPPIVVDCGFGAEAAVRRGRTLLRPVDQALADAGIDPATVEDVIVTHLHYDHAGNLPLFPRARFHLQAAEMAFATGPEMARAATRAPFDCDPVVEMVRLVYGERVVFHSGAAEIAPGIRLHHMPGHSAGLQAVEVTTARGPVFLASDVAHLYANIIREKPFPIVADVPAYLRSIRALVALAPSLGHIIPGHDPLVARAFPGEAGAKDIVRVDLPPTLSIEENAWPPSAS